LPKPKTQKTMFSDFSNAFTKTYHSNLTNLI